MIRSDVDRTNRELTTFYEISKVLASSLDVSKTFREAINIMVAMMDWRRSLVVVAADDGVLRGMCAVGLSQAEQQRIHFQVGEGIVGRVYATSMPIVVPDISREPLFLNRTGAADQSPGETIAYMAVPIRAERRTLGVLTVDRDNMDSKAVFSDDLRMLSMVATLMGQALVLHRSIRAAHEQLQDEARQMHKALKAPTYQLDKVVGVSPPMQEVFAQVHQVAPARTTVLLRGESGTGKEVIARAVHNLSPRKEAPFIRVNCAALTESLLESELFGHEKGSFTGAQGQRKGRFEMAHGGTLFLDEIGDISSAFQAKLLRVLQEREFERVGGNQAVKVDVRLILATNRNLESMVQNGEFRADLYYRINVVSINLPPLRERREDIPAMAEHFLSRFNRENARNVKFTPKAMRVMTSCYWPGNVRELENCVERTATMCTQEEITDLAFPCHDNRCLTKVLHHIEREDAVRPTRLLDIPVTEVPGSRSSHAGHPSQAVPPATPAGNSYAGGGLPAGYASPSSHGPNSYGYTPSGGGTLASGDDKPAGERDRLIWAMEKCGWVQAKAARLLNITPRQMGYALQKYNIEVRKF